MSCVDEEQRFGRAWAVQPRDSEQVKSEGECDSNNSRDYTQHHEIEDHQVGEEEQTARVTKRR